MYYGIEPRRYFPRSDLGWDGDAFGNEWEMGYSVYAPADGETFWDVYEDDGRGNGNFVKAFPTEEEAIKFAKGEAGL